MNASFVLIQPDQPPREIAINRPQTIIGRQTDCQIRIPLDAISRQHCSVSTEGGKLTLRDLGSSNGTYVNRRRVNQSELSAGDVVAVGPCVFVVRVDGQPERVDADEALKLGSVATQGAAAMAASPTKPTKGLLDDEKPTVSMDMEDSSLSDFDFLDDEEDDQPKL